VHFTEVEPDPFSPFSPYAFKNIIYLTLYALQAGDMKLKFLMILLLFASADLFAVITKWQDVEIVNGLIIVDVEIAGVPAKALLDSGATFMAISPSFLEENSIPYVKGRKYTSMGAHGTFRSHMIKEIDVTIFGKQFPLKNVHGIKKSRIYYILKSVRRPLFSGRGKGVRFNFRGVHLKE
jgi:hypothetical protein